MVVPDLATTQTLSSSAATVTYNAELLAIVAPPLEAELAQQLAQKTFSEQAKAILKRLLAGQRPGIQDLARELHLSHGKFVLADRDRNL